MTQFTPRRPLSIFLALVTMVAMLVGPARQALAIDIPVDCDGGDSLQVAIDSAGVGDRLLVTGTCTENILIDGKNH